MDKEKGALCSIKDVVYMLTCVICGARYIGETFQAFGCRCSQHMSVKPDKSAVKEHKCECHPDAENKNWQFKGEIIARGLGDVKRKIREAIEVEEHDPEINRRAEGNGTISIF